MNENLIKKLESKAKQIRIDIIKMLGEAGSGHPGGALSSADIFAALYFSVMRHDPKKPDWKERDMFILSKGHVCPGLYAALAGSGYFPEDEIMTLRKLGSRLDGHPSKTKGLPGIEISSGSLGMGLSVANGVALGFKLNKSSQRAYCLMGDGELQEGQIWEAAMTSAHYKLDNVCGIVDENGLQIDGKVEEQMGLGDLSGKWKTFGWNVIQIDGHNMNEILEAFNRAAEVKGKPTVIIARTVKGKGVSFMENQAGWHGKAPDKEQTAQAIKELES